VKQPIRKAAIIKLFSLAMCLIIGPGSTADGGQGKSGKGSSQASNAGSQQSASQGAGQSPAGSPSGSTPGITSGGPPIEAILFAYRALAADATAITEAISEKVKEQVVLIGNPTDFAGIVLWRTVMGQAALLHRREDTCHKQVQQVPSLPRYSESVPQLFGAPFVANPTDVQTLIQTLASMFAVNESLSEFPAALTDTPLINLLANQIRKTPATVYVPSVYTPNLTRRIDLEGTYVYEKLEQLEGDRAEAQMDVKTLQSLPQALLNARAVSQEPSFPQRDRDLAKQLLDKISQTTINFDLACSGAVISGVDAFEATLLTGQAPASQGQNKSATANIAGNISPAGGPNPLLGGASPQPQGANTQPNVKNPAQKALGPQLGAAPPQQPGVQNPGQAAGAQNPSSAQNNATGQSGSVLQQILGADLLLHQIWKGESASEKIDAQIQKIHILALNTLESGGGQLTKSNLFLGSRNYFGGGAVATFGLYGVDGTLECGGYVFAYRGHVRDKDFEKAVATTAPTAVVFSDCK
jgi:hypothetical protein